MPSMDLRHARTGGALGPDSAIPGLDIDPPQVTIRNGKPLYESSIADSDHGSGVGGWISRMVKGKDDEGKGANGRYKALGQDEDEGNGNV